MTAQTQISRDEYFATHPATQKQIDFITRLLKELGELGPDHLPTARQLYTYYADLHGKGEFTIAVASGTIDSLKERIAELKREEQSKIQWPAVPTGRYAYAKDENDPDSIAFFRVVVKEDGFPLLWVYSSDEQLPIKGIAQKRTVLQKIADLGDLECMKLFGQKSKMCGECGRRLTTEESRAIGIGPICLDKRMG